jgi:hypothetical protein
MAVDPYGREIVLDDLMVLPIPFNAPSPTCVVVQYAERMIDPVPVAYGAAVAGTEPSHIEEGCDVSLRPGSGDEGITVARLIRENATWRVDPDFAPTRLASAARRDR